MVTYCSIFSVNCAYFSKGPNTCSNKGKCLYKETTGMAAGHIIRGLSYCLANQAEIMKQYDEIKEMLRNNNEEKGR